ncbi:MAG: RelA/SpoT family protein [Porphyromonas sp.]|nr:RelA/SpoT family protein [Porphyromonas sp.]
MKEESKKVQDYDAVVQAAFQQLLSDYLSSNHRKRTEPIIKAFHLAKSAHYGAKRKSGEPYILHPIAVAEICCNEIGLGSTSISAALLHDVVEDTDYTVEDIRDMFGDTIARIVDGLTKLSGEILAEVTMGKDKASAQLENIRHLLLTSNDDIRILLVKIADRLHNMRTLDSMPETKQAKIAAETRLFYSPLAERLGMYGIMTELQDLSLKYDHPTEYADIERLKEESSRRQSSLFEQFYKGIKEDLVNLGLDYEIQHRMKGTYSIWNKMRTKQLPFNEIYDIFAIRIVFEPETPESEYDDCFRIYRVISSKYRVKNDRTRDWLSQPKENGYQALHLTVMGPTGEWVEVQIRSRRMHEMAERGLAAHWRYKQDPDEVDKVEEMILENVRVLLSNPGPHASDDYETMMYKFSTQDMLIFTHKGEQVRVPQNFTVLDFAFMQGKEIGNHCLGAKVNHQMVNIDHPLSNGDQVEILTAAKVYPKAEWLHYVTSPQAKRYIQEYLTSSRQQDLQLGKQILEAYVNDKGYALQDLIPHRGPVLIYPSKEDFYLAIRSGEIVLTPDLLEKLAAKMEEGRERHPEELQLWDSDETEVPSLSKDQLKSLYTLTSLDGKRNYIRALCCKPVFGEEVHGLLNAKNQVEVHLKSCPTAMYLKAAQGDSIVAVAWGPHIHSNFGITIELEGANADGFVYNIVTTLRSMRIPLMGIRFSSSKDRAIGQIKVRVNNKEEVQYLFQRLRDENDLVRIHLVRPESNE